MTRTHYGARLAGTSIAALLALGLAAQAAPLPLTICSIDDRSGAAADTGIESLNGLHMALDPVNAAGGINGQAIEIIEYDGKTDPQLSATLASRCAEDDGGLLIIGGSPTAPAAAMVPVANQNRIPFYILAAASDALTDDAAYQFRFGPRTRQDALSVANQLADLGVKRVGIINNSVPFGIDGSTTVTAALKEKGIEVVARETYDVAATDVTPQVINLSAADPDVILIYPYPADGARVVRTIRQMGLEAPLIMPRVGLMSTFRELAGADADGILVPSSVDITRPEVKAFFDDYGARFTPVAPTPSAVQGHDAGTLAARVLADADVQAAVQAGDLPGAREAIRAATGRLGQFTGLQGRAGMTYQFSPEQHHGPADDTIFVFTQVANGGKDLTAPDLAAIRPAP